MFQNKFSEVVQLSNSSYSIEPRLNTFPMHSEVTVAMPAKYYEDSNKLQALEIKNALSKWIKFVQFHNLEPADVWQNRLSISTIMFIDVFQRKLGYRFSMDEISYLHRISENGCLRKEHFTSKGIVWDKKNNLSSYYTLNTVASHKSMLEIKRRRPSTPKVAVRKDNTERQSSNDKIPEQIQKISKTKTDSKVCTAYNQMTKTFLKSGFTSEKIQDLKLQALRGNLQMNALQKKWQFVVMAGEMNKWLQESWNQKDNKNAPNPKFKIINHNQAFTIVRNDGKGQEQIIPEIVFLKKYSAMKKKQENKPLQNNIKQIGIAIFGALDNITNKAQPNRINQRDHELNQSLLHIMRVRNTLEYQYRILSEAAINT